MKKFLIAIGTILILLFPKAEAQTSDLWKFTGGYLNPIVSTWNVKVPSLVGCAVVQTSAAGALSCGTGLAGSALSGSGAVNQISYFTAAHTLSGATNFFWNQSTKQLSIGTATTKAKLTVIGSGAFTGTLSGSALKLQSGAYVLGNVSIGKSTQGLAKLDVVGTISGSALTFMGPSISYFQSGSLSIGKTTNTAKLDVVGTMSGRQLVIGGKAPAGGSIASFYGGNVFMGDAGNTGYNLYFARNGTTIGGIGATSGVFSFFGGATANTQMTLTTNGNLGIGVGGTSGVNARLVVSGSTIIHERGTLASNTRKAGISLEVKGVASGSALRLSSGAIMLGNVAIGKSTQGLTMLEVVGGFSGRSLQIGGTAAAITNVLTGTATLDFASLVSLGCEDLTITVTGAVAGDPVFLGVPNASVVANSNFSAWVSSANTVTTRFCTFISGDPASGSFRADVLTTTP